MQEIKILVVDDEPEIREIILLFLGFQYQGDFFEAENANEAIQKIVEQGPFQLIVSDFNMPKANGLVLFQYLKNNHIETPFTLVTSDQLEDHPEFMNQPFTNYVQKPFNEETFLKEINTLLDMMGTKFKRDHEYIPISILTLKRIKNINCPIYIRLNNDKLVKVLNEGSLFTEEELLRFQTKKQLYLYVSKDQYQNLTQQFKSNIYSDMVFTSLERKIEDQLNLSASVQELLNNSIKTFGWSEDINELAHKNILITQAAIKSSSELDSIFKWMQDEDQEYSVLHSSLLVFFTSALCSKLNFENKRASEILALASFFHDVSLSDHQIKNEVAFIKALKSGSKLNKEDLEIIRIHPQSSIKIIEPWKHCPKELITIIENHHELPDGSGFPKGLKGSDLCELTHCFIVAQFVIDLLLKVKNKESVISELRSCESFKTDPLSKKITQAAIELLSST